MSTTRDAGQEGDVIGPGTTTDTSRPRQADKGRFELWRYTPSSVNQGYSAFFKMTCHDSTAGWQSWVNSTADDAGKPAAVGTQGPTTIVASWAVPFGF